MLWYLNYIFFKKKIFFEYKHKKGTCWKKSTKFRIFCVSSISTPCACYVHIWKNIFFPRKLLCFLESLNKYRPDRPNTEKVIWDENFGDTNLHFWPFFQIFVLFLENCPKITAMPPKMKIWHEINSLVFKLYIF